MARDVFAPQRVRIALGRVVRDGKREPFDRLDLAAGHALTAVVHDAERSLRARMTAIRGAAEPCGRLAVVGGSAAGGIGDANADLELRTEVAGVGFVNRIVNRIMTGTRRARASNERADQRDGAHESAPLHDASL